MPENFLAILVVLTPLLIRQFIQYAFIFLNARKPVIRMKEDLRFRAEYLMVVYAATIGFCIADSFEPSPLRVALGLLLVTVGSIIGTSAVWKIRSSITNEMCILVGFSFCSSGIYSVSRHPMRNSTVLELAGVVFAFSSSIFAGLLLLIYIGLVVFRNREEDDFLSLGALSSVQE